MPWFWTDDLARLLTDNGVAPSPALEKWLRQPHAIRGEGEAAVIAERLLSEESEEPFLAA